MWPAVTVAIADLAPWLVMTASAGAVGYALGRVRLRLANLESRQERLRSVVQEAADRLAGSLRDWGEELRSEVTDSSVRVGRAVQVQALMETGNGGVGELAALVRAANRLPPQLPGLLSALLAHQVRLLVETVRQVEEGDALHYDGEDREWLLALATSARTSIDSISLETTDSAHGVDGGFWNSDLGERYLLAQHEGVERYGLRIRRVFISDRPGFRQDPEFLATRRRQTARGVQVRALDWVCIPRERRDDITDLTIFDAALGYHLTPTSVVVAARDGPGRSAPVRLRTELRTGPDYVAGRLALMDFLWELAAEREAPG
jgi:hypothetical protein